MRRIWGPALCLAVLLLRDLSACWAAPSSRAPPPPRQESESQHLCLSSINSERAALPFPHLGSRALLGAHPGVPGIDPSSQSVRLESPSISRINLLFAFSLSREIQTWNVRPFLMNQEAPAIVLILVVKHGGGNGSPEEEDKKDVVCWTRRGIREGPPG